MNLRRLDSTFSAQKYSVRIIFFVEENKRVFENFSSSTTTTKQVSVDEVTVLTKKDDEDTLTNERKISFE